MRLHHSRVDSRREKRIHVIWISLLSLWGVFLSGVLSDLTSSPGMLQSWKLRSLLRSRQTELASLESETVRMDQERRKFEENSIVQEREIRRVLGYAAKDELIFDFSTY